MSMFSLRIFEISYTVEGQLVCIEYPLTMPVSFAAGHTPNYHVITGENIAWHFFSKQPLTWEQAREQAIKIWQSKERWKLVDLKAASNFLRDRKKAMSRKGK